MIETNSEKRSAFIEKWYQREKKAERLAGIVLLFAAGLVVAFDQPGDSYTAMILPALLSGSIVLFLNSRRPRAARTELHFLKAEKQTQRSVYMGLGAILLLSQFTERPLALIMGGLLLLAALWYQWRAYQIQQFDNLSKQDPNKYDDKI